MELPSTADTARAVGIAVQTASAGATGAAVTDCTTVTTAAAGTADAARISSPVED
jgi:hypothetical protein